MANMKDFMDENGKPTAKAIIEGANLYLPQDAREHLEDLGVLVYKDSSANKCGVVSSSYEILAGLSLLDEEFKAIKPELVKNVLARLADIANAEAGAMMAYWLKHGKKMKMTHISELVSKRINRFTDDIAAYLKPLDLNAPENKKLLQVFIDYVPACIKTGHLEQCLRRVPDMHKKAIISTALATRLVYGKGIDWEPTVVDILPILLNCPTMSTAPAACTATDSVMEVDVKKEVNDDKKKAAPKGKKAKKKGKGAQAKKEAPSPVDNEKATPPESKKRKRT